MLLGLIWLHVFYLFHHHFPLVLPFLSLLVFQQELPSVSKIVRSLKVTLILTNFCEQDSDQIQLTDTCNDHYLPPDSLPVRGWRTFKPVI